MTDAQALAALSQWLDESMSDEHPDAVTWCRVSKITEEAGETIAALIGAGGWNPRKGVTHTDADVIAELLDVAITALGAVEHLTGNSGESMGLLSEKIAAVARRAGVNA